MTSTDLLTTVEVAAALGITRQAVIERVKAGTLQPVFKSPSTNGAYLFAAAAVDSAPGRYER